jgi:hypothetical protein
MSKFVTGFVVGAGATAYAAYKSKMFTRPTVGSVAKKQAENVAYRAGERLYEFAETSATRLNGYMDDLAAKGRVDDVTEAADFEAVSEDEEHAESVVIDARDPVEVLKGLAGQVRESLTSEEADDLRRGIKKEFDKKIRGAAQRVQSSLDSTIPEVVSVLNKRLGDLHDAPAKDDALGKSDDDNTAENLVPDVVVVIETSEAVGSNSVQTEGTKPVVRNGKLGPIIRGDNARRLRQMMKDTHEEVLRMDKRWFGDRNGDEGNDADNAK